MIRIAKQSKEQYEVYKPELYIIEKVENALLSAISFKLSPDHFRKKKLLKQYENLYGEKATKDFFKQLKQETKEPFRFKAMKEGLCNFGENKSLAEIYDHTLTPLPYYKIVQVSPNNGGYNPDKNDGEGGLDANKLGGFDPNKARFRGFSYGVLLVLRL